VNYLRNERGATAIAPWSTRARSGAPVAMPVQWSALEVYSRADVFSITGAANLAQERTDPWPRHCALHQHMPDARAAPDALQAKKVARGSEPYSV